MCVFWEETDSVRVRRKRVVLYFIAQRLPFCQFFLYILFVLGEKDECGVEGRKEKKRKEKKRKGRTKQHKIPEQQVPIDFLIPSLQYLEQIIHL